jgi:hypothetical protein
MHGKEFDARRMCVVTVAMNMTLVQCPYCVADDGSRPMTAVADGRFVCGKCGHLAIPSDDHFECACRKCFELRVSRLGSIR